MWVACDVVILDKGEPSNYENGLDNAHCVTVRRRRKCGPFGEGKKNYVVRRAGIVGECVV